jgi:hypothetical protein
MDNLSSQDEPALVTKVETWFSNLPENQQCKMPPGPILTSIAARRESIMANTEAVFDVEENSHAKTLPKPWYEMDSVDEVTVNARTSQALAFRYKLDPDFVKAVVWMESTRGWYDRFSPNNKTIRPMNVHFHLSSQLRTNKANLQNRKLNIATGVAQGGSSRPY